MVSPSSYPAAMPAISGSLSHLSSSLLRVSSSPSGFGGGLGGRSFASADDGGAAFRTAVAVTTYCLDPTCSPSVASTIAVAVVAVATAVADCNVSSADRLAAAAADDDDDDDDDIESRLGGETEGRGRGLSHPDPRAAACRGIRLRCWSGVRIASAMNKLYVYCWGSSPALQQLKPTAV